VKGATIVGAFAVFDAIELTMSATPRDRPFGRVMPEPMCSDE
jgi:hypothetical protein